MLNISLPVYNAQPALEITDRFIQETIVKADQKTNHVWISHCWYSAITSVKSPSFCMTTFSASITNLTVLLPLSH